MKKSITTLVIFFLASWLTTTLAQDCDPACSSFGTCVNGSDSISVCSCFSGYSNGICDNRIDSVCDAAFGNVSQLETDYPPFINLGETSLSSGLFTLTINGPLVNGRENTIVSFSNDSNPVCSYPGPNWVKALDNDSCVDAFVASINWTEAVFCGWTVNNSVGGVSSYKANIVVDHTDYVDSFRNTSIYRQTEHVLPIQINFDTDITVSTDITIFSPVAILAANTHQSYDPDTGTGTIEITSSIQWPYQLSNIAIASYPTGGGLSAVIIETTSGTCPDTVDEVCLQKFEITITPNDACTLTGAYNVTYETVCRDSASEDCPIVDPIPGSFVADVTSENFCASVNVDIGLGGTLTSYDDTTEAYTSERDDFFLGDTAVFRADLTSDSGVELNSTTIQDVFLQWGINNNTAYLFQIPNTTTAGTATSFTILDESTNFAGFSFAPTVTVTPVADDENELFSVFCTLLVTYADVPTKRIVTVRLDHPSQGKIVSRSTELATRNSQTNHGGSISFGIAAEMIVQARQNEPEESGSAASSVSPSFWRF